MSLIRKRRSTEKELAASRANGGKSRGPATEMGKARSAAGRLRHGLLSVRADGPMEEFGEDAEEYKQLMDSLIEDLQPRAGLELELVAGMRGTIWRLRRAERMQDGAVLRRLRTGLHIEDLALRPKLSYAREVYGRLLALGQALQCRGYIPSPEEIAQLKAALGQNPLPAAQRLMDLLHVLGEVGASISASPGEDARLNASPAGAEEKTKAVYQEVMHALDKTLLQHRALLDMALEESDKVRSPENIAALMASDKESSLQMQKLSDSYIRQLWRLTRMFLMLRRTAPEEAGSR